MFNLLILLVGCIFSTAAADDTCPVTEHSVDLSKLPYINNVVLHNCQYAGLMTTRNETMARNQTAELH